MSPDDSLHPDPSVPDRPRYRPPRVIIYHRDELLRQMGPAKACACFNPFSTGSSHPDKEGDKLFEFEE
jgi:hypothetical protein